MKNLINKFKILSEDPAKCAEECKKVAIAFNTYVRNMYYSPGEESSFDEYNNTDKYINVGDSSKYIIEEVFNKFIEKEYGKQ